MPVTRIVKLAKRTGVRSSSIGAMSKNQRVDKGRLEAEHGELLSHRKPDPPGADIRDVPESSDTRRDEWLL